MDDAERKKFDAAEADGTLPRLRATVHSFCTPLWWEVNGNTVIGNGSVCVVATGQAVFGVTADHVVAAYEKQKAKDAGTFCQLGSAPFDPSLNLIARSEHWDLATFKIPAFTLRHWGEHHKIFKADAWPPATIKKGDPIILGGYPVNRRSQPDGTRPTTLTLDFVSFISRADNWSENHMAFCFDSGSWYWPQGESLPANPELSGASGGPCFRIIPSEGRIELAGFIYQGHTEYELIRVRQANLIHADGTIAPPPVGHSQHTQGA